MASQYQDQASSNARATASMIQALMAKYRTGQLPGDSLKTYVAVAIAYGAGRAVTLADIGMASKLAQKGQHAVPLGLTLPAETEQAINDAVETIFDDENFDEWGDNLSPEFLENFDSLAARAERLANAATLDAGAEAFNTAMAESPTVIGWTRVAHPDCCAMCQKLANGEVFPTSVQMIRHPQDRCVAEPAILHTTTTEADNGTD